MGYDPQQNKMVLFTREQVEKFYDPNAILTPIEKVQREWTRFAEGETVTVKGVNFRIHEIGETRLVLKPINKAEFAERQVAA